MLHMKQSTQHISSKIRSYGFIGVVLKLNNRLWNAKHLETVEYGHHYDAGKVIYEDEYLLVISSSDGIVCVHKYSLSLID